MKHIVVKSVGGIDMGKIQLILGASFLLFGTQEELP
jgi:hypothetical protein